MRYCKRFNNGLRLIAEDMEGLFSVSVGLLVKTGSINENEENNGISHFIEHTMFKGTNKRSAFEISDYVDRIGAQINAFTSKEITCYYTKSTSDHLEDSLEVLSDIFFNSVFDKDELDRERKVIIEEINMSEDTPEDLCLDLLSEGYYGKTGLGRPILGSIKNVSSFTKKDIENYMDKYYTADNVIISVAGKVDVKALEDYIQKYFVDNFKRLKSIPQYSESNLCLKNLYKVKQIEQSHISFAIPAPKLSKEFADPLNIANIVLGGSMSSRLFQKIREELGLSYSIYSYLSMYKTQGDLEIYAGVNTDSRELATDAIIKQIKLMAKGVSEQEFLRGKEQLKSSFIMARESTSSQMISYGKYLLFFDEELDFERRLKDIEKITIEQVNDVAEEFFKTDKLATATVGPKPSALKI